MSLDGLLALDATTTHRLPGTHKRRLLLQRVLFLFYRGQATLVLTDEASQVELLLGSGLVAAETVGRLESVFAGIKHEIWPDAQVFHFLQI